MDGEHETMERTDRKAAAKAARAAARSKGRKKDDGEQARTRMEKAILNRKKAEAHCPVCGAQGNWLHVSAKKPIRYLLCGHCRVGTIKVVVTDEEVAEALGG